MDLANSEHEVGEVRATNLDTLPPLYGDGLRGGGPVQRASDKRDGANDDERR